MFIDEEAYEKKKDDATRKISDKADKKQLIPTPKTAEAIIDANFSLIYDRESSKARLLRYYQQNIREFYKENGKHIL